MKNGNRKSVLITGITGQDGAYLAEQYLKKGYLVHGLRRRTSSINIDRINHLVNPTPHPRFVLHYGDMTDSTNVHDIISRTKPDVIINLAAQSHVRVSFEIPEATANCDALGVLRLVEAVKNLGLDKTRIVQASTSEMFGNEPAPQSEDTLMTPASPYAAAKKYAFDISKIYREAYGMHISNSICFNHESEKRGHNFVTRKITLTAARIKLGLQKVMSIGNLDAKRDWGYAPDYTRAMILMAEQKRPGDYVIATGEAHTVREFVEIAFGELGMTVVWKGSGLKEKGYCKETGKMIIKVDSYYYRPLEVNHLCGDATKAKDVLGWKPKVKFRELVSKMVKHDYEMIRRTELKK